MTKAQKTATIEKLVKHFDYMDARWEVEEEGYEDFRDYRKSMKQKVEAEGGTFVSLENSPMRAVFKLGRKKLPCPLTPKTIPFNLLKGKKQYFL